VADWQKSKKKYFYMLSKWTERMESGTRAKNQEPRQKTKDKRLKIKESRIKSQESRQKTKDKRTKIKEP